MLLERLIQRAGGKFDVELFLTSSRIVSLLGGRWRFLHDAALQPISQMKFHGIAD